MYVELWKREMVTIGQKRTQSDKSGHVGAYPRPQTTMYAENLWQKYCKQLEPVQTL